MGRECRILGRAEQQTHVGNRLLSRALLDVHTRRASLAIMTLIASTGRSLRYE